MSSAGGASSSASTSAAASGSNVRKASNIPNLVFGGDYGPNVDPSRWVVIYPPYLDATRKEREGRKIAKEKCVEKPSMVEIFDCAQMLGFQTALELDKAYCRDFWVRGRIRVRLFNDDKTPRKEDIPNRRILYAKIAALIPQHRERSAKKAQGKKTGGGGGGGGGGAGGGGGKNSGKQGGGGGAGAGGKGQGAQPKKKKKGKR